MPSSMLQGKLLQRAIALPNLRAAWVKVADNQGVPGVDHVTLRRFARTWEDNLVQLAQTVRANTYRPQPLRRFRLPKPHGGWRVISVPTVADRVLQRAVLNVLELPLDRLFLDCSFGYRPGRSVAGAVEALLHHRDAGRVWVLDADIHLFFDSLDHELLAQFLAQAIADPALLALIDLWIKTGAPSRSRAAGISLGSALSPLLSNLYLHRLDRVLCDAGWQVVRYADDFVILCESAPQAQEAHNMVNWALANLRLRLDPGKTQITSFDRGFDFLGVHFERNFYSYLWKAKRVKITGEPEVWDFPYPPAGY